MNTQSKLMVTMLLLLTAAWIFHHFRRQRLSSGQAIFWLILLAAGELLALKPPLIHWITELLWGNLMPVSWISFGGIICLVIYLLYLSMKVNHLQATIVELTRALAKLEAEHRGPEPPEEA